MNQEIALILSSLGIGGVVGSVVTFLLNKRKEIEFSQREQKEKRYKSILLFMDAYLQPLNITYLKEIHPAMKSEADTYEWLKAEYRDMILYSSKDAIIAVKNFINDPSEDNFLRSLLEMRKDLRNKKADFLIGEMKIDPKLKK